MYGTGIPAIGECFSEFEGGFVNFSLDGLRISSKMGNGQS